MTDDDVSLAATTVLHEQRLIDQLVAQLPVTHAKAERALLNQSLAKTLVQFPQGAAFLGQDQTTRCLPIEAMGERQIV